MKRRRGDQFGLLGVAVQLLEEENESGHRSLVCCSCVSLELKPLKSWLSLQ